MPDVPPDDELVPVLVLVPVPVVTPLVVPEPEPVELPVVPTLVEVEPEPDDPLEPVDVDVVPVLVPVVPVLVEVVAGGSAGVRYDSGAANGTLPDAWANVAITVPPVPEDAMN